jgi:hypothetical protein
MTHATDFEADESVTADRTPTNCPFCGHDGAFDGQGEVPDMFKITRAGVISRFETVWYQIRCPECNGRFRMLEEVEEIEE